MSSVSSAGASVITLQFNLGTSLDVAEQEVQAAINGASSLLPADLPAPPVYAKVNPADAPVLTLAVTSDTLPLTEVQNLVNTRLAQKISQVSGRRPGRLSGGQRPAMRIQADTQALASLRHHPGRRCSTAISSANANSAKGSFDGPTRAYTINANDQLLTVDDYTNLIVAYKDERADPPVRRRPGGRERREHRARRLGQRLRRRSSSTSSASPAPTSSRTVDADQGAAARAAGRPAGQRLQVEGADRPHHRHPRLGARRGDRAAASPWSWWCW